MLSASNSTGDPTASLTISNLVFKHASPPPLDGGALAFQGDYSVNLSGDTFTDNLAPGGGSGGAVAIETHAPNATVNLTGDTFTANHTAGGGEGGAVEVQALAPGMTLDVESSTFSTNTTQSSGGGLDVFTAGGAVPTTLSNNTFSGNQIDGCSSSCELDGGGFSLINFTGSTATVTQDDNAFRGFPPAAGHQPGRGRQRDLGRGHGGECAGRGLAQLPPGHRKPDQPPHAE